MATGRCDLPPRSCERDSRLGLPGALGGGETLSQVAPELLLVLAALVAAPAFAQTQLAIDGDWPPPLAVERGLDPHLLDVDGDGDLDLIVLNGPVVALPVAQQSRLYLNDGRGGFTDVTATHLPQQALLSTRGAVGDVDRDGDPDLVLGCGKWGYPAVSRLYLNRGNGVFDDGTAAHMPNLARETQSIALGDIDGDGDLDAVAACIGAPNLVYVNVDGAGTFVDETSSRLPGGAQLSNVVRLFDADGDRDLDLFVGNHSPRGVPGTQNELWLNDGRGVFTDATAARMPPALDFTVDAVAGDVDGDGDTDLVVSNRHQPGRLLRNDGTGTFVDDTAGHFVQGAGFSMGLALGDVDEDGDLDIVNGQGGMSGQAFQSRLFLNDGSGTFADVTATRMPADPGQTLGVALGDIDGDLDLDLVLANSAPDRGELDRLYRNRLRQVESAGSPVRGQLFTATFHARAGFATRAQTVLPVLDLALAPNRPALFSGWGAWSPGTTAVALPALGTSLLPGEVGRATLTLPVPSDPGLGGLFVHLQAVVVHDAAPLRVGLTNAAVATIQ